MRYDNIELAVVVYVSNGNGVRVDAAGWEALRLQKLRVSEERASQKSKQR